MKTQSSIYQLLLFLLSFILIGYGCREDFEPDIIPDKEKIELSSENAKVTINIEGTAAEVIFEPVGGVVEIIITTTLNWDYSTIYKENGEKWCEVSKVGRGLRIDVERNDKSIERNSSILITTSDEKISASIQVNQTGSDPSGDIYIESYDVEMIDDASQVELSVMSGFETWEFSFPENDKEWLSVTKDEEESLLLIETVANKNLEPRNSVLTVRAIEGGEVRVEKEVAINQWAASMIIEFTVQNDGDYIMLPFAGEEVELKVIWDDNNRTAHPFKGSISRISNYITNTYEKSGVYQVRINGKAQKMAYYLDYQSVDIKNREQLTAVIQWGNLQLKTLQYGLFGTKIRSVPEDAIGGLGQVEDCFGVFTNCNELKEIHEDFFKAMVNLKTLVSAFSNCRTLTSVPENLFKHNTQVTNMASLFSGCSNLTTIPENIFTHNTEVTNFSAAFRDTGIASIPAKLFVNNRKVENFNSTFSSTDITSVPQELFENCPEVKTFEMSFFDTRLESIPAGLFKNNTKVESYQSTFNRAPIKTLPEGLFVNSPNVKTFQSTFYACKELETIPGDLFDGCISSLTDINQVFNQCDKLQAIPADLFKPNNVIENFMSAFKLCLSLKKIPEELFENCLIATSFTQIFNGCSSIEYIPEGLFINNAMVTKYGGAFQDCTLLTEIPEKLFNGNSVSTESQAISDIFKGCVNITTIPEDLFSSFVNITNMSYIFMNCKSLTSIPEKLFANNPQVTTFSNAFKGCEKLTLLPESLFDNNRDVTSFSSTFEECVNLEGESPYSLIEEDGKTIKVHLYERSGKYGFKQISSSGRRGCFKNCSKLLDFEEIPSDWK